MKLLFVTGSRGEWGYIRPILRLCEKLEDVEYSLCVTNMHLLPAFGYSAGEIERDGFRIDHKIYMSLDGYTHHSQAKSLGLFLMSFVDILINEEPDWVVLAGDRGEQLMGSIAGAYCYVPVAHIQAGEVSGNIDGMSRHAIGKLAHLHFAANEDAAMRLEKLGEESFRIHMVGAPQVDELRQGLFSTLEEIELRYSVDFQQEYILMVQHPVTEEYDAAADQVELTLRVLNEFDLPKFVILPNNDAGSDMIRYGIEQHRHGNYHVFANLPRQDYLAIMKHSACMIGNSSSGLLEAPTFGVPAVNLGRRQANRVQGINVINAEFQEAAIREALNAALDSSFRRQLRNDLKNPYGDGYSSERVLELLRTIPRDSRLLTKSLTY